MKNGVLNNGVEMPVLGSASTRYLTPKSVKFAEGRNNLFQNELLLSVAGKYDKTVAQVILSWLIQREVVVIPKSVRKKPRARSCKRPCLP